MLVQEDSSYNISKLEKLITEIVPVLWTYTKFVNPIQEFSLKNDALKNGTSRAAQYGSALLDQDTLAVWS